MIHKRPELTAAQITDTAKLILFARGYKIWRQTNSTLKRKNITKGIPDIIGYHKRSGVFVGCEVKKIGDVFSDEQKEFLGALHKSGGIALYAVEESGSVVIKEFSSFTTLKNKNGNSKKLKGTHTGDTHPV